MLIQVRLLQGRKVAIDALVLQIVQASAARYFLEHVGLLQLPEYAGQRLVLHARGIPPVQPQNSLLRRRLGNAQQQADDQPYLSA